MGTCCFPLPGPRICRPFSRLTWESEVPIRPTRLITPLCDLRPIAAATNSPTLSPKDGIAVFPGANSRHETHPRKVLRSMMGPVRSQFFAHLPDPAAVQPEKLPPKSFGKKILPLTLSFHAACREIPTTVMKTRNFEGEGEGGTLRVMHRLITSSRHLSVLPSSLILATEESLCERPS